MLKADEKADATHLRGVPYSMLSPLFSRANIQSVAPGVGENDALSRKILSQLEFNEAMMPLDHSTIVGNAVRSRRFDHNVRKFLQRHPRALIVELGAGLDTRKNRIADVCEQASWVAVDLPAVIELRQQLLQDLAEVRVAGDLNQPDNVWLDVAAEQGDFPAICLVAEGLFYYLTQAAIDALVKAVRDRFTGTGTVVELLFDYYHPSFVGEGKQSSVAKLGTYFTWGVRHPRETCPSVPEFVLLDLEYIDDELPFRTRVFTTFFALRNFGKRAYGLARFGWNNAGPGHSHQPDKNR